MSDRLTIVFHIDSVPMTAAVIAGQASLGGSESACLGLARALKARGHSVHIVTTHLAADAPQVDHAGVTWHPSESLERVLPLMDPDVFVALRQPNVFGRGINARFRVLWNQDMLVGEPAKLITMAYGWAYDAVAYVSEYHRKQWEGVAPELKPLGWVTKNGFDPAHVPTDVAKVPNRVIHISRPERGLRPLLMMWPELRQRVPEAELQICRYQSMYDGEGSAVKALCESFDQAVEQINQKVGGITSLGSLGKPALYRAIAEASVMWYPGVVDFAETSCIAAIESQACGTPFVGSFKGALPETIPGGVLIPGDATTREYQEQSIDAVCRVLAGMRGESPFASATRVMVQDGRQWVKGYTYDALAAEWESFLWKQFDARSQEKGPIVARLLHEDDHVAAQALTDDPAIVAECERVIRGEAQTAEMYGEFALPPEVELDVQRHPRMDMVVKALEGCTSVLDLACGNGAFAIALAEADPARRVYGFDYSAANVAAAKTARDTRGLADRVTFVCEPVCDLATGAVVLPRAEGFDGVFLGEFCEHVGGVQNLLTGVRDLVGDGVKVVITVPSGPLGELLPPDTPAQKGHVHHFRPRDLEAVFGGQDHCLIDYLDCGFTPRGSAVGHWMIQYTTSDKPFGQRPLTHWHRTIRPQLGLSVGILAHNCTPDLARCLHDVWAVADEIIIADCASEDRQELERLAERYHARLLDLPHVQMLEGGFSEARNETLKAATGKWFLWIDADEQLTLAVELHKYLESGVFRGYAIKQNHLMLDAAQHFDTPIRVFRTGPDVQFYGCVHEQPQAGDCNGDILPSLQLHDVQIAHTGYLHEGIRRKKATSRNLPLLVRDREVFPERRLGLVLVLRDLVNQALWQEEATGALAESSKDLYLRAVALFEQHFIDPADKFHAIARPFYETAVRRMDGAVEIEFALGGAANGLRGRHPKPLRWWVREQAQVWPLIAHEQAKIQKQHAPLVIDVEPIDVPSGVAA